MAFTNDPEDIRLSHGVDKEPTSQSPVYLVLSDEERAKGFIRPVYKTYQHVDPECEGVTTMAIPLAETYARRPDFYGSTYCAKCRMHRPVGRNGEFVWVTPDGTVTTILVGT